MKNMVSLAERALQASTIVIALATALAGCGGGDSGGSMGSAVAHSATPPADSINPQVVPHNASYRGKSYSQWEVSFWQWAMALPINGPLPHPFLNCTRPISAGQTRNVWYWSAPDIPNEMCDQSATIIPAGTSIFLSTLDIEASSLDDPSGPFRQATEAGQLAVAQQFANYIQDLFVTIDNVPLTDVTAYRTTTAQFDFTAPSPWVFNMNPDSGGPGTSAGDGYFFMLKPLPPGPHTIHYGGRFHIPASVFGVPVDIIKDTTLMITVGAV